MTKKIKILFLFFAFSLLFSTFGAFAAELKYFESSYDVAGSLILATAGPSFQYFITYDDYISGFDIWVENEGSSGTASFGLRDSNDNLLSAKTITVPYVARAPGGQKLHIVFDQPVAVVSQQTYKIKMISSMPKLKLYYSNLIDVQVHNATNNIEKQIKPAYIGTNEQSFFFKFALYEDGDIAQPIVSNFSVNVISSEKASFRFNANEPVDYKIVFWPDGVNTQETDFFNDFYSCDEGIKECVLEINTSPNTDYNYQLIVKDAWGNETNISGNFISSSDWFYSSATSTPVSTSTPQKMENDSGLIISDDSIVSLDYKSVKIAWRTNKAANSSLLIRLDDPGEQAIISVGDLVFELDHVLNSGDILRANTEYIAKIASIDVKGNYISQDINFKTLNSVFSPNEQNSEDENNQQPDNNQASSTAPNQSQDNPDNPVENIINEASNSQSVLSGNIQQNNYGDYNFNIAWNNNSYNEISDGYRIDVFDNNKNLAKRLLISREKRGAVIEGLSSGEYYAIIYSDNGGIFEKIAAPKDFKIPIAEGKILKNIERLKKYLSGPVLYITVFSFLAIVGIAVFYVIKRKNGRQ